jgi:hypothetical protein
MPAKAGIHGRGAVPVTEMDSRVRGNDGNPSTKITP